MSKKLSTNSIFTELSIFVLTLSIAVPVLAQSETYGPPANIPDASSMPSGQYGPPANIPNGPSAGQQGPSEEQINAMQKKGEEQQLKGMKQGATGMEKALKQFENTYAGMEKKGIEISSATKEKLKNTRKDIETIKSAKTVDEIEAIDQQAIQDQIEALGDDVGKYQQMQGLKKMLASMERGMVSFDKQLVKLQKQGLVIPSDITEDVAKLKSGLAVIKAAKGPDELDAANPDELGDLMQKVNESRPQLEMLAKWPRILRQADQQITRNQKELTKTKALVARLKTQEVDVSEDYAIFEADVNKLKTVRDEANALIKAGQSEEAFNKMEDEFFNKLDDIGEHQRVIQTMSNLSRFTAEFKKSMTASQKLIQKLAKLKLNTSELKNIYDQALVKGNEIVVMIKTKPIDEDAILVAMDTMESLKQDFQNKADELSGGQTMPWETKAPAQFQPMTLPKDFDKYIPQPTLTN